MKKSEKDILNCLNVCEKGDTCIGCPLNSLNSPECVSIMAREAKQLIEENQKRITELEQRLEKSVELPCKVGDILYTNIGYKYSRLKNRPFSCEVVFIGLNYKYSILNVVYQDGSMEQFNSYDIGKTVFLTKEEAEQALKGGADDE